MAQVDTRVDDELTVRVDALVAVGVAGPSEAVRLDPVTLVDAHCRRLQRVRRATLIVKADELGPRQAEVCGALRALADC